jgi:predicted pyridoxine 5'-phosphate oxidase superfamily flavin-nucleotide-binding protein
MFVIDAELKSFLEAGVAAQLGTASADGRPDAVNAWGPRVNPDGSVSIFIDTVRAPRPLANLASNPRVAVVFADPVSYRSVQLKGRWRSTSKPSPAEDAWVERHRELLASTLALVGDDPQAKRNTSFDDVTRIDFDVEHAFDQTPGPRAGREL